MLVLNNSVHSVKISGGKASGLYGITVCIQVATLVTRRHVSVTNVAIATSDAKLAMVSSHIC